MNLGQVYQSAAAWDKLAGVPMKPALAYQILKYAKLVGAELDVVESQRIALIRDITSTEEGQNATIKPGTPEMKEYVTRFGEVLCVESSLGQSPVSFADVVDAIDGQGDTLTIQDLSALEPFFKE